MNEGKGRIFRRTDEKYLVYLPKALCEDSMFPFKLVEMPEGGASLRVKVSFDIGKKRLVIEPLEHTD